MNGRCCAAAEACKHTANDLQVLWCAFPWPSRRMATGGREAHITFSNLTSRLCNMSVSASLPKGKVTADLYVAGSASF